MLILGSVGQGGSNSSEDVRVVQNLLNDWRQQNRLPAIAVDGLVGPETIGAITSFQQRCTGIVDGRVDPHGPALARLEESYVGGPLKDLASALLSALNHVDLLFRKSPSYPVSWLVTIGRLRALAQRHGGASATPVSFPVQRAALPLARSPLFGATLTEQFVIMIALAGITLIFAAFMQIVQSKEFKRLAKELGKLPARFAEVLSDMIDEMSKKWQELMEELKKIRATAQRCMDKVQQMGIPPPGCVAAMARYLALETRVNQLMSEFFSLAIKVGTELHTGQVPDPAELARMSALLTQVSELVPDLISALNDMIDKCGCEDKPNVF